TGRAGRGRPSTGPAATEIISTTSANVRRASHTSGSAATSATAAAAGTVAAATSACPGSSGAIGPGRAAAAGTLPAPCAVITAIAAGIFRRPYAVGRCAPRPQGTGTDTAAAAALGANR